MGGTHPDDLPQEEVDRILRETASRIRKYGLEMVAIMSLETMKPLAYVGGELSRFALSPFLPFLGRGMEDLGEKLIAVFGKRENIDKLIRLLEEPPEEDKGSG